MDDRDILFMQEALKEAKVAAAKGEVPIGAVLVYKEEVVARAHNLVEETRDAMAHAEVLCIKKGALFFDNWRLNSTTLYCTLEPCFMCAGALILSRVETLVWGAPDFRHGANGSVMNILEAPHPIHQLTIRKGVLMHECGELLTNFFKKRREENARSI